MFQLTAPLREPTIWLTSSPLTPRVSTHGSLAGADTRQPCWQKKRREFQLTAPLREPTYNVNRICSSINVSTHGSLAGADIVGVIRQGDFVCFNSRLPCGSRPLCMILCIASGCFNSRLPCGSRQILSFPKLHCLRVSTHGSLAGADTTGIIYFMGGLPFQLTAPLREPT